MDVEREEVRVVGASWERKATGWRPVVYVYRSDLSAYNPAMILVPMPKHSLASDPQYRCAWIMLRPRKVTIVRGEGSAAWKLAHYVQAAWEEAAKTAVQRAHAG